MASVVIRISRDWLHLLHKFMYDTVLKCHVALPVLSERAKLMIQQMA